MKKSIVVFCLIFTSFKVISQTPSFEGNKSTSSVLLQKVVPPSPTAVSLGKYGDQQINMFTGTSAVNIPIYEIKTNGFSIPLSLAYSTSGLRVTEAASWVGLGWSLGGSGVVTRIVKGTPDGVQYPLDIRTWPMPLTYSNVSDNAWNYIHSQLSVGIMDPEPDIYIARAGKLSVKFYYDMHKRIQTIPYNNEVKIKFDGATDQYVITDVDGTQYFFGGSQSTELTYSSNPSYSSYTTSWFLSKIITPVGAQVLYNNVKGTNFITQDQYSETEEVKVNGNTGNCATPQAAPRTVQYSVQTFLPVFLSTIETDQEIVYLTRDVTERSDMPGDYSLTGIKIYSKSSGKYLYNYSFVYSYFPQVSAVCWGSTSVPQHSHSQTAICKRLRLDQFIEKGNDLNTTGYKTYQFVYSSTPIPSRCSLDQDFWGFYNGAGNTSLLPQTSDPSFQASSFNAVSRESNHLYASAGMLQKIIYPTGGESDFTYEPNQIITNSSGTGFQTSTASVSGISPTFSSTVAFTIAYSQFLTLNFSLSDPNLLDQGLQRKVEIINQSGIVQFSAINYNTPAEGVLVHDPSSAFLGAVTGLPAGTYTLKVSRNYAYSSYPSIPTLGIQASVTYSATLPVTTINRPIGGFRIRKVIDKIESAGSEINLKEYFYDNPYFAADIKNSDCISSYDRWFSNSTPSITYGCSFKSRITSSVQPIGSVQGSHIAYGKVTCSYGTSGSNGKTEFFYSTDADQGGFSLTPYFRPITSYDHRRGNLLNQIDYDASGNIKRIKANTYDYTLKYAGLFSSPYYTHDEPVIVVTGPSLIPQKIISFKDFALPSEWVRTKNSSETVYEGSAYLTTTKEFSYDNPNYSYVTQTKTTNNKGNIIAQINKYPLDYKPATPSSNEEIERKFETDYQTLFNSFVSSNNAATNATATNASYATYQSGYDNLINSRATALTNYQSTFTTLANGTADPVLKGKYQLIAKNKVGELIESLVTKDISTELNKLSNDFRDFTGNILFEKFNKSNLGNVLENEITVNSYDLKGNILQATAKDGIVKSFIWDYLNIYPVAELINAIQSDIAYSSFEADGKGNWTFSGIASNDPNSFTGKKVYMLNGANNITKTGLDASKNYIITYWSKTGSATVNGTTATAGISRLGWVYFEHQLPANTTSIIVTGTVTIDELRLFPKGALMTTYAYEPLVGITHQCNANNKVANYIYDPFGRLLLIRDQDKNILKKYCYNYQGQAENCGLLGNSILSGAYTKACSGAYIGSTVTYTVPAGTYYASTQTAADAMAQNDITANGQTYANTIGTCTAGITVNCQNGKSAPYNIRFTNNSTGLSTVITVPPFSTSGSILIASGTYAVSFYPAGTVLTCTFNINGLTQVNTGANFSNVVISATSNASIN